MFRKIPWKGGTAIIAGAVILCAGLFVAPAAAEDGGGDAGVTTTSTPTANPEAPQDGSEAQDGTATAAPEQEATVEDTPAAPEQEAPVEDPPADPLVAQDAEAIPEGTLSVNVLLSRLGLVEGRSTTPSHGNISRIPSAIPASTYRAFIVTDSFGDGPTFQATTIYRITNLGVPSQNWVTFGVVVHNSSVSATCRVTNGDPASSTSTPATQYNCSTSQDDSWPNNAHVTFSMSQNRAAETTGTLETRGNVSLAQGAYDFNDLPYHRAGTAEVAQNSSTTFEVVMREGDHPATGNNLARARFVYQILDNNVEKNYWVYGWTQNERAGSFKRSAACFISDVNPKDAAVPWDQLNREVQTPYTCGQVDAPGSGDNGDFRATLRVQNRDLHVIAATDRATQLDLLNRYCQGAAPDCGVSLTHAVKMLGPGVPVTDIYDNHSDTDVWKPDLEISRTETAKSSWGVEASATFEESGFGAKFKQSIKVTKKWETSTSTTVKTKYSVSVPPGFSGWVEAQAPIIHSEGDIIVFARDSGVSYLLEGVVVDFMDPSRQWHVAQVNAPIFEEIKPHPGVGGADGGAGGGLSAANVDPAERALAAGRLTGAGNRLATTGYDSSAQSGGIALGAALLCGGLGLLVFRRRRAASLS